jgi:predicted Ser/Thr protein kinase
MDRTLGPYQIVEELGRGGMAVVYKAWQPGLERYVALKVLPEYFQHDPDFLARFHREAKAAAQLSHPNIVHVYDTGQANGAHYIAMEYVEGGSLRDRLARGAMSLEEAQGVLDGVAAALDHAHSRGLVHRDIKPGNILFTADGRAKVTDFGIAHAADGTQLTRTGMILGTPEYMAPEQAGGERVDYRVDLYALGVVLYQMLTGQAPYRGTTPHATLHAVIYESPTPPRQVRPELSVAVESVILKSLAKQPAERFQAGQALVGAFRRARAGEVVKVPAGARQVAEARVEGRRSAVLLGVAIVAIAVVVLGLIGWLLLSPPPDGDAEATVTALALLDRGATSTVFVLATGATATATPADPSSATETVAAVEREGGTATAAAGATQTVIAAATVIDEAARRTAEAMATLGALEATQTAAARLTDTPPPSVTPTTIPPTFTPQPPPSPTAKPTSVPPTATAKPTPVPPQPTPGCAMARGWPFDAMGDAPKLGCPTDPSDSTHYSHQYFEGGQMIYRHDLRRIYVLYYTDGTWAHFPDTYNEGEPWQLNEYDPPPGLQQPIKGFDRVWENHPQVQDRVGWAQRGEVGLMGGNYQDFEGGTALWLDHQGYLTAYYLLLKDGSWQQR